MWSVQPNTTSPRGNFSITVRTLRNGTGTDFFYDPIPDYMFEVPATTGQAVVTVNGITAQCSTDREFIGQWWDPYYETNAYDSNTYSAALNRYHNCSFSYSTVATPMVFNSSTGTSGNVATVGTEVTITGSGFVSAGAPNGTVQVRFGGAACNITSVLETEITCILGQMKTGYYHPVVIVSCSGQAAIDDGSDQIFFSLQVHRSADPSFKPYRIPCLPSPAPSTLTHRMPFLEVCGAVH